MSNGTVAALSEARFPKTYREYWVVVLSTLLSTFYLWLWTFSFDPNLIYAILALYLFLIVDVIVTRTVVREDRIESINLLGRRTLLKDDIDRLEVREGQYKGKPVETYRLIPKYDDDKPLRISGTLAKDCARLPWMARIPTKQVSAAPPTKPCPGTVIAIRIALYGVIFGFVGLMFLPAAVPSLQPYFALMTLFLPWIIFPYVYRFRRERLRDPDGATSRALVSILIIPAALLFSLMYPLVYGGNHVFVVSADTLPLTCASIALALITLVIVHFSSFNTSNLTAGVLVFIAGVAGLYGYGAALTINELFDRSAPQNFPVVIETKFVRTGRGAGSFFRLSPWGAEAMKREYATSRNTYSRLQVSDSICASLYLGAIGMRWYKLSDSCP